MYYYAYLDENDICTAIYALPSSITGDRFIPLPDNDPSIVGKRYNRSTYSFETVYYYAILNDKNVVTEVEFKFTEQQTSTVYRAITFAQYQTVKGLYWNGTDYVIPPISIAAIASTDEVNYKDQDKWLSTKLDEMDANISANENDISTISTNLSTVVASLTTVSQNLSALITTVSGKANALHSHTAADVSGVVKTVNGNSPDENGNITITSGGMTADEILAAVETVDGAGSGLDADKLDGMEAADFAAADHDHDSEYAAIDHIHAGMVTNADLLDYAPISSVTEALAGKSDVTHNHDNVYAPVSHSHSMENVTGLVTALAGKANIEHNHNTAYAAISHSHEIENVTGLATALANKADSTHNHDNAYAGINHTHDGYAASDHTHTGYATSASVSALENDIAGKADATHFHSQSDVTGLTAALNGKANTSHSHAISDVTGLQTALNGKAASSHTHSDYLSTAGGTLNGNLNVNGLVRVNNQQCMFDSGSMVTLSTNNRETMIAGSKIYSKVAISTSSDARLKENVQPAPVEDLINMIKNLEIKKFNYIGNNEKNIGVIAQDFMHNNPTYISELYIRQCCDDGMYSFKESELVYALAAAVQDIYSRLED